MDHHLCIINRRTEISKPIGDRLDLLKIVSHGHLAHLDVTKLSREVELAIDLVVVEEVVDAVPERDGEGIVTRRHDGVEDTERDGPIEPGDDGGVEEGPLGSRRGGGVGVDVIQEGVLAAGGAEEGAPLPMDAGVKRELDGDVALDGGEADGLGVQRGQRERPRLRARPGPSVAVGGQDGLGGGLVLGLVGGVLELLGGFISIGGRHRRGGVRAAQAHGARATVAHRGGGFGGGGRWGAAQS